MDFALVGSKGIFDLMRWYILVAIVVFIGSELMRPKYPLPDLSEYPIDESFELTIEMIEKDFDKYGLDCDIYCEWFGYTVSKETYNIILAHAIASKERLEVLERAGTKGKVLKVINRWFIPIVLLLVVPFVYYSTRFIITIFRKEWGSIPQ